MQTIKHKLIPSISERLTKYQNILSLPPMERKQVISSVSPLDVENPEGVVFRQVCDFGNALDIVTNSKTIIFSSKQAEIFHELTNTYTSPLDYKLPFPDVLLQFDTPFEVRFPLRRNTGMRHSSFGIVVTPNGIYKRTV